MNRVIGTIEGDSSTRSQGQGLFLLALYALLAAAYFYLRFGWQWMDGDSYRLTAASVGVYEAATVAPRYGAYPYGYAYATLNVFLMHLSGLPASAVQVYLQPFLIVLLVPPAYAAFRSLTANRFVAFLTSLLLLLQPEFLFEAARSSHSKVTWLLALVLIYSLARSLRSPTVGRGFARWVLLFYVVAFGLISSNSFFASSYLFGIAFSFVGGGLLVRWRGAASRPTSRLARLSYVTLSTGILLFLFYFYLYPPALAQFRTLDSQMDRLATSLLGFEAPGDPYGYVRATWLNGWVYIGLTLLNWLVLGLSFIAWLRQARVLLLRREDLPPRRLLLWLFYTAFALLLALSIIVDLAGVLSANLQVRLFPYLMMIALPLAAEVVVEGAEWARSRRPMARQGVALATVLGALFFSSASLLKATREPLLTNQWSFYTRSERSGVQWMGEHARGTRVWAGIGTRLDLVGSAYGDWDAVGIYTQSGPGGCAEACDVLLTEATAMQGRRLGITLPDVRSHLKVYDNGTDALYHWRPQTPYQR